MPVTTTRHTTVTTSHAGMAVHNISLRGLAGGILIVLILALVLYIIGFATTAWSISGFAERHYGLWQDCECRSGGIDTAWFHAIQAMITIGLIGLLIAVILIVLYLSVHSISKNTTILALTIVCFVSVVFMIIGFVVFASKMEGLSWSFVTSVVASILCLIAGILSVIQMRQSGVQ